MTEAQIRLLACPACGGDLQLAGGNGSERLESACGKSFPIVNGIPDFRGSAHQDSATVNGWTVEWRDLASDIQFILPHARRVLDSYGLTAEKVRGKVAMDVGCGAGRWSLLLREMGAASVVTLDLSEAVYVARNTLGGQANHAWARADMRVAPVRDKSVDVLIAIEVVQHTQNPPETLKALAQKLKPGGIMAFSLYFLPERFLGRVKVRIMNTIRRILSFFPPGCVVPFAKLAAPMYRSKIFHPLFRIIFIKADYDDRDEHIFILNHDNYVWGYHYSYTRENILKIIRDAGLEVVAEGAYIPSHFLLRKPA